MESQDELQEQMVATLPWRASVLPRRRGSVLGRRPQSWKRSSAPENTDLHTRLKTYGLELSGIRTDERWGQD